MPSVVTAIIAAGRNWTIDYHAGQACNVAIKVFTCIKTAWKRVGNMFATVLTTITTIWRPVFRVSAKKLPQVKTDLKPKNTCFQHNTNVRSRLDLIKLCVTILQQTFQSPWKVHVTKERSLIGFAARMLRTSWNIWTSNANWRWKMSFIRFCWFHHFAYVHSLVTA